MVGGTFMLSRYLNTGLIVLFLSLQVAFSAVVTRGPYLQVGTQSSIIIRWRTDIATDSIVNYGLAQGSLTSSATDSTSTTEHEVKLTGLSSDTKYFYSVGSSSGTLAGNDANHFFVTHPPIGTAKATRVWVVGDAGTNGTPGSDQARVRDAYYAYTGSRHTDLWLQLGDNAYNTGTDAAFQTKCFNAFSNIFRKSVCWSTIGNHDAAYATSIGLDPANPPPNLPYFLSFTMPQNGEAGGVASGTEKYYSFDYGNIHFICLDSQTSGSWLAGSAMRTWLANDLAATTAKWIIAFWHHPPFSRGSNYDHSGMRNNILPVLEQGGVDLIVCGHSHVYERSFFLDGFYGDATTFNPTTHIKAPGSGKEDGTGAYSKVPGPHKGTVYAVAGSSGQVTSGGSMNHPVMYTSQLALGSMILDFDGSRLDAKFLNDAGVIKDYFTLVKTSGGAPVLTTVSVTPSTGIVAPGGTQQFTAVAKDQFGVNMSPQPSFTWTFSGSGSNGSINSSGLFTGGSSEGGPFTVTAAAGGKSVTAQITVASATTVSYQDGVNAYAGTVDTYISETVPTTSFATDARLNCNYAPPTASTPENSQVLMKFNLSGIPVNATVTSASLTLFVTRTNSVDVADTLAMDKVTSSWTEAHTWSMGVPARTPSGITLPMPNNVGPTNAYVIAGMGSLVQNWVTTPSANHGVIIYSTSRLNYRFASREISQIDIRPKLTITYSMSAGTPDSDSDGMPDTWETSYFGSLAQNQNSDFDGDGISNLAEFSSGTVPTNRTSRLVVTSEAHNGTSFDVTWQSVNGKQYTIESSTNMTAWSVAGTHTASGPTATWSDTNVSPNTKKFYRIKLP
jgi:acid phosphatase type 7